jgi:opacity protein-like surface antigen
LKRLSTISIFLFIILLTSGILNSQEIRVDTIKITKTRTIKIVTVRTAPKFILQLNGSFHFGALELSAHNGGFSSLDFTEGKSFCARNGYGVNLTGKIPVGKKANFWIDALAGYNRFQSNLWAKNEGEGNVSYNVISGGLGAEYNFTSTHKVKYFIGANFQVSMISGKVSLISLDTLKTKSDYTIKQAVRLGYSVFTGLEYAFDKNFGINFGFRFTHANLLLKESKESSTVAEINFNDNSVSTPQLYSGWKQFAYISAFAGFSVYFGVKERRYKIP